MGDQKPIQGELFTQGTQKQSSAKREYDRRKAMGLCVNCPSPAATGKVQCQPCIDKSVTRQAATRARGLAEGLCTTCGGPRDRPGRRLCSRCNGYHSAARKKRTSTGRCPCGRPRDRTDRHKCQGCREQDAARKARHEANGLCPCGQAAPKAGTKWCPACAEADTQRAVRQRAGRAANGMCVECGGAPSRPRRTTCKECGARQTAATRRWIKRHPDRAVAMWQANRFRREQRLLVSGGNFTGNEWSALKKSQNYTCLCCGRREPEIKLTVDHVIPVSAGGRNCIDNLQGLCLECNLDKHTTDTDYRPVTKPSKDS